MIEKVQQTQKLERQVAEIIWDELRTKFALCWGDRFSVYDPQVLDLSEVASKVIEKVRSA